MTLNITTTEQYQVQIEKAGNPQKNGIDSGVKQYDTAADLPSAADFGAGVAKFDSSLAVSDASKWRSVSKIGRSVRYATFGDSTANIPGAMSPDSQFVDILTAAFPGSGTTNLGSDAEKNWVSNLYPNSYRVFNGGVSGETTTQMLARDAAVYSTTRKAITDLLTTYPDVVFLRGGSINDVTALTASSTQDDVTAIFTRHQTIINRLLACGVTVIDEGIFGYDPGNSSADTLFRLAAIVTLNDMFKAYAATTSGKVIYLDTLNVTRGNTGRYLSGVSYDGTHLNGVGGRLVGQLEADMLTILFGESDGQRYKGANLIGGQAMMQTITTPGYGNLASGFTCSTSGTATRQNAKVEVLDNRIFQTVELVIGAASSGGGIYCPFGTVLNGAANNDIYGAEVDVYIEPSASGPLAIKDAYFIGAFQITGPTGNVVYRPIVGKVPTFTEATHFKLVIPPMQIQLPSGSVSGGNFYFEFRTDDFNTYGSHVVKIGVSNPRIVKLGNTLLNI